MIISNTAWLHIPTKPKHGSVQIHQKIFRFTKRIKRKSNKVISFFSFREISTDNSNIDKFPIKLQNIRYKYNWHRNEYDNNIQLNDIHLIINWPRYDKKNIFRKLSNKPFQIKLNFDNKISIIETVFIYSAEIKIPKWLWYLPWQQINIVNVEITLTPIKIN